MRGEGRDHGGLGPGRDGDKTQDTFPLYGGYVGRGSNLKDLRREPRTVEHEREREREREKERKRERPKFQVYLYVNMYRECYNVA